MLRSSSPKYERAIAKDFPEDVSFLSNNTTPSFLKTGDSTRSLLTPLYASDNEDVDEGCYDQSKTNSVNGNDENSKNKINSNSKEHLSSVTKSKTSSKTAGTTVIKKVSPNSKTQQDATYITQKSSHSTSSSSSSSNTTSVSNDSDDSATNQTRSVMVTQESRVPSEAHAKSWEEWVMEKLLLQINEQKMKKQTEYQSQIKRKEKEIDKQKNLEMAKTNRVEWLKKKNYEIKKQEEEKKAQKEFETLKQAQEEKLKCVKSQEKFQQWLNMKYEKQVNAEKEKKEKEKLYQKDLQQKKNLSEEAYKKWRKGVKTKQSTSLNKHSKILPYNNLPKPSYLNPIPWTDVSYPACNSKPKPEQFYSPPLLWKEIETRERKNKKKKSQKPVKKHSCVDLSIKEKIK